MRSVTRSGLCVEERGVGVARRWPRGGGRLSLGRGRRLRTTAVPVGNDDGMDVVVRVAGTADLDAVLAVHAAHNPAMRPAGPASRLELDTWNRIQRSEDLTAYLAEVGRTPVGTAAVMVMANLTYQCAPTAFIEPVVVVPKQRRRGIATEILQRIIEDLRVAGCDKVQLLSHKRHADDGAHDLYRKCGFEAEAEGFRRYLQRPGDRDPGHR